MSETQRDIGVGPGETMDPLAPVGVEEAKRIEGRTPWQLAMSRVRRDRVTMTAIGIVLFMVLLGLAAPILVALDVLNPTAFHNDLIDANTGGLAKAPWGGMSLAHPFGVEPGTGRDVLSRIVLGVTFSMTVAITATMIAVAIGTVLGLIAGFRGGVVDFWISRVIDMTLSFPQTLMLLALSGMFIAWLVLLGVPEGNMANGVYLVLILGLFGWPTIARIIRGQVLSLREREFVEAARSLGANNRRIYFKELLPNLWAPLLVYGTLMLPSFVSAEAALSFLNVGIKPPTPTLGNILTDSKDWTAAPNFFFFPAIFIAVIVLSFNLMGDGLRDALDPKADR